MSKLKEKRPMRPDRSASVTQAVVVALQGMIRDGTFKGGMALPPQRDLAQQLGVSRASLREAVSILEIGRAHV